MNYWRLSGFYLFYFATLGALVPYWSLYLQSLDFSVTEIGQLTAILMATKIVAPYVWGWIADHTGRRIAIVRIASLLAALAFAGVFAGTGYWAGRRAPNMTANGACSKNSTGWSPESCSAR